MPSAQSSSRRATPFPPKPRLFCVSDPVQASASHLAGVREGRFSFNGETHACGVPPDWSHNPSADLEWLILLNKFYFAPALAIDGVRSGTPEDLTLCCRLIESWIDAEMEPGFIAADVTGRRLQNWIYAWHALTQSDAQFDLPEGFEAKLTASVLNQTAWLADNLHTSRNHRTLELYAILLVAIGFPHFPPSAAWERFAIAALNDNILSDFRPDGGHCEQSTHYHCIVLNNFILALRLLQENGRDFSDAAHERLAAALNFASAIHRPDGDIAAFSDADGGGYEAMIVEGRARIRGAQAHSKTSVLFPEAGYAVLCSAPTSEEAESDQRWLIFDTGPLGAGNHGHFDLLSVEAFAYGRPLIVDPGRYTYDESGSVNWRAGFRSTAAHSTVEVDGRNQTRYEPGKSKMKVKGPAPEHAILSFASTTALTQVTGLARSSEYPAVHRRQVMLVQDAYWIIIDDLQSPQAHDYRLRYQLAPQLSGAALNRSSDDGWEMEAPGLSVKLLANAPVSASIEQGWISRLYGEKTAAPRLCFHARSPRVQFVSLLVPWRDQPPEIEFFRERNKLRVCLGDHLGRRIDHISSPLLDGVTDCLASVGRVVRAGGDA